MRASTKSFQCLARSLGFLLLTGLLISGATPGLQVPPGQKLEQGGSMIRVNVALVQTDVMVFDRRGRFVDNLKKEQFELRVDGKVQPISFMERVSAGSPHDEESWAKAEGRSVPTPRVEGSSNPGRTLLFFVDDWHLSADSTMRARTALSNLINTSMGPHDRIAVVAASGQLGLRGELTSDKAAVLASLAKVTFKNPGVENLDSISLAVAERFLAALRDLLQAAAALPGRKAVFLLSDGFVMEPLTKRSDIVSRIREVTNTAARAGIVIYTIDARGLVVGIPDARTKRGADITGAQDALNALAADTGGRFIKNTNALDTAMITSLEEISRYYLLAWPVDTEQLKPGQFSTIRASIRGRSDLTVRVRQGWLDLSGLVSSREFKASNARGNPSVSTRPQQPAPPTTAEIYANARSVVDLSVEELRRAYPAELGRLEFAENQTELIPILQKVGATVEEFFREFPNTTSKEHVRLEQLRSDGKVEDHLEQSFNYVLEVRPDKEGFGWEEFRTDSRGRPIQRDRLRGYSSLASGFAATTVFLHPLYQATSRFRYLGMQRSDPEAMVIAFAQKPGSGVYLGTFSTLGLPTTPLFYQGIAWVDPRTNQIVRMRTDLLTPRGDVGLTRQTSEIWFSEVQFNTVSRTFWLPHEVVVTAQWFGQTLRNRHQYSDYAVFLVESSEKIELPKIKKAP